MNDQPNKIPERIYIDADAFAGECKSHKYGGWRLVTQVHIETHPAIDRVGYIRELTAKECADKLRDVQTENRVLHTRIAQLELAVVDIMACTDPMRGGADRTAEASRIHELCAETLTQPARNKT